MRATRAYMENIMRMSWLAGRSKLRLDGHLHPEHAHYVDTAHRPCETRITCRNYSVTVEGDDTDQRQTLVINARG
jgi:hypothetical protein